MPHAVEIGKLVDGGKSAQIDLPTLLETRLLIQGISGGGKSHTIRRILEETHGQVQHFVIDREGEFPSLRERFDYVLIGKGGDKAARVEQAAALAESMLELQASVICDLSELRPADRRAFVARFIAALVDAPKALWHRALVVIDEADFFCPQKQRAESAGAVADLLSKGRKRGLCAVLATQRIAKLDKDAAAECGNYMIGRTRWPDDRARALEMLAISGAPAKEIDATLGALKLGSFYCVGDAFVPSDLNLVQVGPVQTRHPKIGHGQLIAPAPPPSSRIREVLARLDHIADEKAEEANELATLRTKAVTQAREITRLEREMAAERERKGGLSDADARKREAEWQRVFDELKRERQDLAGAISAISDAFQDMGDLDRLAKAGDRILRTINRFDKPDFEGPDAPAPRPESPAVTAHHSPSKPAIERQRAPVISRAKVDAKVDSDCDRHLVAGERKMLEVLWRCSPGGSPAVLTRSQWGLLAGYAIKGGTFQAYARHLKREGLIELGQREVSLTAAGFAMFPDTPIPMSPAETLEMWRGALVLGERTMLDVLVDAPSGLVREELGERSGYNMTGGTGQAYLRKLKRNGLAVESGGIIRLSEDLR